jgi:hypothetical protein
MPYLSAPSTLAAIGLKSKLAVATCFAGRHLRDSSYVFVLMERGTKRVATSGPELCRMAGLARDSLPEEHIAKRSVTLWSEVSSA